MANREVTEEWKKTQFSVSLPAWMQTAIRNDGRPQSQLVEEAVTKFLDLTPPKNRFVDMQDDD